ncbi:MAG: hypothetical protein ACRD0P_07620 [Stackebrandtia sp.]
MPRIDPAIPDVVNAAWIADALGVYRSYVHRLIEDGTLTARQVTTPTGDGTWLCRREVAEAFIAKRAAKHTAADED